jgi:hypothetical protein
MDGVNFPILNIPFLCRKIPAATSYGLLSPSVENMFGDSVACGGFVG